LGAIHLGIFQQSYRDGNISTGTKALAIADTRPAYEKLAEPFRILERIGDDAEE
jgi:hypothetical protein